jgi:hypothetical protein
MEVLAYMLINTLLYLSTNLWSRAIKFFKGDKWLLSLELLFWSLFFIPVYIVVKIGASGLTKWLFNLRLDIFRKFA